MIAVPWPARSVIGESVSFAVAGRPDTLPVSPVKATLGWLVSVNDPVIAVVGVPLALILLTDARIPISEKVSWAAGGMAPGCAAVVAESPASLPTGLN